MDYKLGVKYIIEESNCIGEKHRKCKGCVGEFIYIRGSKYKSFIGDVDDCIIRSYPDRCFDEGSLVGINCVFRLEKVVVTGVLEISDGL